MLWQERGHRTLSTVVGRKSSSRQIAARVVPPRSFRLAVLLTLSCAQGSRGIDAERLEEEDRR